MSVRADAETLRSIPIFAGCDPVHLQVLAFSSERRPYKAGDTLIAKGQSGDSAYLLLSGQADLSNGCDVIGFAGPGAFLGEVAMIGEGPYAVTATAAVPLTAAAISRKLFMRVAEEYPEFGQAVYAAVARKVETTMAELRAVKAMLDQAKTFSSL